MSLEPPQASPPGGRQGLSGPLRGRRVGVTRAREQAGPLCARLSALGATVLEAPTIRIEDPEPAHRRALVEAAGRLGEVGWLLFTSPNAPPRLLQALEEAGAGARLPEGLRVGCIGPATRRAVEACGWACDLLPAEYVAEGLLEALRGEVRAGARILLPRALEARDVLPETLRAWGAEVEVIPVYQTVAVEALAPDQRAALEAGVDLVTVTSSSVARAFHRLTAGWLPAARVPLLAIGPITAATARELGYREVHQAAEYSLEGLVEAVLAILAPPHP